MDSQDNCGNLMAFCYFQRFCEGKKRKDVVTSKTSKERNISAYSSVKIDESEIAF